MLCGKSKPIRKRGGYVMNEFVLPPNTGVAAIGIKTGLIVPHDDIAAITSDAVNSVVENGDIICVTEAVVARSQNRYVSCEDLAKDIQDKLELKPGSTIAVISPIASRNRFSLILRSLALATRGGKVIVQLSIPFDEVGNRVMDEEFANTRLRFKQTLKSLREARGNTPQLNVLIRELLAALKLQELGYNIESIRKITGQGIADLTVRTPEGEIAVVEVTFADINRAAQKAVGIKKDVPQAKKAIAIAVNLEHQELKLADAHQILENPELEPRILDYGPQRDSYLEPDIIFSDELGDRTFPHPITGVDYRDLYLEMIKKGGARGDVIYTNNPLRVYDLGYIDGVCLGEVHEAEKRRELFHAFGGMVPVVSLKDIGPPPWGVIGSNVSDFDRGVMKLLPEDADGSADEIKKRIEQDTGKKVETLIFGDGAYKDPDTGIYELADPHPAIGSSQGLRQAKLRTGSKLKLQVDTLYRKGLSREEIAEKLKTPGNNSSQQELGTTPRSVTSILGSLADLITGSADAGTPIVLIRGFDYGKIEK